MEICFIDECYGKTRCCITNRNYYEEFRNIEEVIKFLRNCHIDILFLDARYYSYLSEGLKYYKPTIDIIEIEITVKSNSSREFIRSCNQRLSEMYAFRSLKKVEEHENREKLRISKNYF